MELLVNFGADLLYKPPQSGLNATQLASKLGQDRIVKFLTFYCHKRNVPKKEIPGILDGPEKAKTLLSKAKSLLSSQIKSKVGAQNFLQPKQNVSKDCRN